MNRTTTVEAPHVVCPACGTVNRVSADRPAAAAVCGRCRLPLFGGRPESVNTATFERHLQANDIPVLVDFWAPWCGPCRMMAPAFEEAARLLGPKARLLKLNVDEEPGPAARYGVQSIPTLILFRKGQPVARTAGAMDARRLVAWTERAL